MWRSLGVGLTLEHVWRSQFIIRRYQTVYYCTTLRSLFSSFNVIAVQRRNHRGFVGCVPHTWACSTEYQKHVYVQVYLFLVGLLEHWWSASGVFSVSFFSSQWLLSGLWESLGFAADAQTAERFSSVGCFFITGMYWSPRLLLRTIMLW